MLSPYFLRRFTRRSLFIGILVVSLFLVMLSLMTYPIFFSRKNKPVDQNSSSPKVANQSDEILPPKEAKVIEVSNLFTYDPQKRLGIGSLSNYNPNEPAFSLKLPDGWILKKPDSPINRLSTISPGVEQNGQEERATLGINMLKPQKSTLIEAVKAEKDAISGVGEDRYFFTDKETKLNGHPAYLLEYKIKLGGTGAEQQWDHHIDVFFIKNGYLVNLYASTKEEDWAKFTETIEKSINTFKLLTS